MIWAAIPLAALAAPWVVEAARRPMSDKLRQNAEGQFADLPRGKTHYRWHGPKDGPVAVAIHGLTTPSYVWDGLIPHLTGAGFRVLSYDIFGRGLSDRPRGAQDTDFFLDQLEALLADQGIDGPVTLIGNSMGSAISTAFAAKHPIRVRQAVLLVPAGMGHDLGAVAAFTRKTPVIGDWLMMAFYPGKIRKAAEAERALPSSVPQIGARQEAELRCRGFLRSVTASLRGALAQELEAEHKALAKSGVPVVAVWGADDTVIPISCKPVLERWNPNATHVVLPGAGHGLVYTRTDDLAADLLPLMIKG
ncbi:alpha/beta fold hydrolase [Shimia biformata]|uniref:alpha/beta fold hydrolase n=1 Tax=Shimia biformata TaxID=1294299 RepID=UPI0019511123|nr:alpha/beta hydrolase [Shimia biformata]